MIDINNNIIIAAAADAAIKLLLLLLVFKWIKTKKKKQGEIHLLQQNYELVELICWLLLCHG